jgi:sialic acid synthase SpsE
MLKSLELSKETHKLLIEHCKQVGIKFLSTGFDVEDVDLLVELGVDLLKIPSGEITNYSYLKHIGAIGKPVILSTGMSNISDIDGALKLLESPASIFLESLDQP